ncbi:MAG: hypothetical protein H0U73_03790 [Tatlockia sp.]|nr:hypothetical protein [Tatlockia sp.]
MNWEEFRHLALIARNAYLCRDTEDAELILQEYEAIFNSYFEKYRDTAKKSTNAFELYQSALRSLDRNNRGALKQFKSAIELEINKAFGTSFLSADVVIVGGGPIGYAEAFGFAKLGLKVVVLEKYPEFKRRHTLVMQATQLEKYMHATNTTEEPKLIKLLLQIKKSPNIRTNQLQETFKQLAEDAGVVTLIETVKPETIEEQLLQYHPQLIIGADGTHGVINDTLFPIGNQIKHEVDFAMQVRYEVNGDPERNWEKSIQFTQSLARQGLIATEQFGRPDEKTGRTPVTVQLIIPKEDFLPLHKAGVNAKEPIKPLSELKNAHLIPRHLEDFINSYIQEKIKSGDDIDLGSLLISVNELPASRAANVFTKYKGVSVCLNGDAALGLSYFKGLNAGIESLAMFFNKLKPAFEMGFFESLQLPSLLSAYQAWFSPYADKKVEEVKGYSSSRIRPAMKLVKVTRDMKLSSIADIQGDEKPVLQAFYRLHAKAGKNERVVFDPYPHRSYDPNIKLLQFAYIPITYTLKKIAKLFLDFFKPYKGLYQFKEDSKQPFRGFGNLGMGLIKLVVGFFTANIPRFGDGFVNILRGLIEIGTTPLALTVKPLIRGFLWLLFGSAKVEKGDGIKNLVSIGEALLANQEDDDFSLIKMQALLGVSNDIHRKFDKSLRRFQETEVDQTQEKKCIHALTADEPLTRNKFRNYFSLFGGTPAEISNEDDMQELSKVASGSCI